MEHPTVRAIDTRQWQSYLILRSTTDERKRDDMSSEVQTRAGTYGI